MQKGVMIIGGLAALAVLAVIAGDGKAADEEEAAPLPPLPKYSGPPRNAEEAHGRLMTLLRMRPDATSHQADGYSGHTYQVTEQSSKGTWTYARGGGPWAQGLAFGEEADVAKTLADYGVKLDVYGRSGFPIDDYGRFVAGVSGDPFGALLSVAGFALPFIPGVGPAASAALAASIAIAKGESLQDATLAAIRSAIPGGAMGQLAFDTGVAVAMGEDVDKAAKDALLAEIPGGKEAYAEGVAAWEAYGPK